MYDATPPQTEDIKWRNFTDNLQLTYIPTNSSFSRQGGQNYIQTNLIDGYYINTHNVVLYTTTTNHNHNLKSNHSLVTLYIPPNILLARQYSLVSSILPVQSKPPRILNAIPQENIGKFKTQFFK